MLSLSVRRTVGWRGGPAFGLQAAAAAALQRRAGRFRAPGEGRRGGAGERRAPHPVTEDTRAQEKLPRAVGRRSRPTRARGSDVVRWQAPPARDVVDTQVWAIERLGSGLQTQHPLPLLQLPPLLNRCHDGF